MAVAATFTADPLLQPLELVLRELGLRPVLQLAPCHQLFQQLLSPGSVLATHRGTANILLIRLEDFVREVLEPADALSLIERTSKALADALLQFSRRSGSPLLVLLLPVSSLRAEPLSDALQTATARLHQQLANCPSVHRIDVARIDARCGPDEGHDRLRDELVHIPYTDEYFAAAALVLAQSIDTLAAHSRPERAGEPRLELATGAAVLQALRSRSRRTRPLRERALQATNPTERELLILWQELLNIEGIGVEDNYFALGGNSRLAESLFAEIAYRRGLRLSLATLIAAPTVRSLARALQREQAAQAHQAASLLVELKGGGPLNFFLVHADNGEVIPYRELALKLPGALSVYGIEPRRLARIPLAAGSIDEMARDYVAQVQTLQPHGPYRLGGLCAGAAIACEMARQLQSAGERVAIVALIDAAPDHGGHRRLSGLDQLRAALLGRVQWMGVRIRFALLRRRLAQRRPWPAYLPALTAREICACAAARHVPLPLAGARVLLLLPREGSPGPDAGAYRDSVTEFEILRVDGAYDTLLQEPHVGMLAAALTERLLSKVEGKTETATAGARLR